MPTYGELLNRVARHLVTQHGVATDLSGAAASFLVRECGLTPILIAGIAGGPLGESPRQTFPAKGA